MHINELAEIFPKKSGPIDQFFEGEESLPPLLFHHEDLFHGLENASTVDQASLTNMLNHIHFVDGTVLVLLRHPSYKESILMRACPEPCLGSLLTCHWADRDISGLELENFQCLHLIIDDGQSMILVPADLQEINREYLRVRLPENSHAVGRRQKRRYVCKGVIAEMSQNGFRVKGELRDFSPDGFRIRMSSDESCSFQRFNPDESVAIHLQLDQKIIFSGPCKCIRQRRDSAEWEIVLDPLEKEIKRLKKKYNRSLRQQLVPTPTLVFRHPFIQKKVRLEVHDLSISGFSVYEEVDEGVLVPGMIIPELMIEFAGAVKLTCSAQVLYSLKEEPHSCRCGLTILDMDIGACSRLIQILTSAVDPYAYISAEVDMDALWEFFFHTGFIYPKKYRLIQPHRKTFKETYQRLYQENPEIARHFTSQKNGRIYGHISMVRAYQRSWMIHHHAARNMGNKRTGFMVLKQILHYVHGMHRLPAANMDYVMCYYRPENKVPDIVFGGFERDLNDLGGCSMDLFSYLPYTRLSLGVQLPDEWALKESSKLDFWELNRFYSQQSGGLLLKVLGLDNGASVTDSLEKAYARCGFMRKWRAYSLTQGGELNAVLIVDQSDLGFNLSELLNGIKVIITNPEGLPWNTLSTAISQLTGRFQSERIPVMLYPFSYVENYEIPCEKQYQAWILNLQYGNEYLEFMQRRFRVGYK